MKVLVIEREGPQPGVKAEREDLEQEAARLWELQQAGIVRELYFRQDRPEAVLMLECANPEEGIQILESLPLVASGLIRFEVIALRAYPGFARLFK